MQLAFDGKFLQYAGMIEKFLAKIDDFLARHGKSPSWFGEHFMNDKSFVFQLRRGERSPSLRTVEKVERDMLEYEHGVNA